MNTNEYLTKIDALKAEADALGILPAAQTKNIDEWYAVELTYTSNALEGNTLTRQETAQVIEKDISVEGKSLNELLEAKNHAQALALVRELEKNGGINLGVILDIHQKILQKIDDVNAGKLRTVPVRIAGSASIMPNPAKVPELMDGFVAWLGENHAHPVNKAIEAHYRLVTIHPFTDGNGRTARLLMNLILMKSGYAPLIIPKESRREYVSSLEKAQTKGDAAADMAGKADYENYEKFMYEKMLDSSNEYLAMAKGQDKKTEKN